jgi:hypothetical protein
MMELRESFEMALAEFGKKAGLELALADGQCNFTVDGNVEVEIDYIEEAQVAIAWAVIGSAPDDGYACARAKTLLALNALNAPNGGFSFSLDPESRRFVAHDNRPAELFDSADRVAAWIGALVEIVHNIREDFAMRFPEPDIMPGDEEEEAETEQEV